MKRGRKNSCGAGCAPGGLAAINSAASKHPIGIYYLDFFCEEAELNIELDGSQHGFPDQRRHDEVREKFLKSRGIKTLRFWNSQLRRNAQGIRDTIFNEVQTRAPHPLPDYTKPTRLES